MRKPVKKILYLLFLRLKTQSGQSHHHFIVKGELYRTGNLLTVDKGSVRRLQIPEEERSVPVRKLRMDAACLGIGQRQLDGSAVPSDLARELLHGNPVGLAVAFKDDHDFRSKVDLGGDRNQGNRRSRRRGRSRRRYGSRRLYGCRRRCGDALRRLGIVHRCAAIGVVRIVLRFSPPDAIAFLLFEKQLDRLSKGGAV